MTVIDMETFRKRRKINRPLPDFDSLEQPYDITVKYGNTNFEERPDSMEYQLQRLENEGFVHDSE